ncbi:sensor domain-containing diguanylate cyclase [Fluoribacter dumoffii]|uniref:Probable diguanylate cyclase AdrA n=1 Tax=Fluoribacter dumoffii TaxID=463 RepID=A0A377GDP9_9GAMM|nr:sensor domain-containing diguanylate cyclase [Fluoribacter dumoffii]KTC91236.1 fused adenylate cyclase/two component hybrid sensor/regulator [Fluoribacter dumoffii NY 23]MCW8387597.1 sensor domain-containing diguanylate cyclase [Fluoribacter dumoffii]MCW8416858.1 sensor domain-containing diguanylate cyclase [Fluoribacter dumoffii]MCW8455302.1 sensor domain-containing diguanylate cyclase [Fluoribacter dumoffii]MCW8460620.1 sensor domain-containing diguanylate cyclase [Fluoribacter dumoffii]
MIPPDKPEDETARLATLYKLHILDTEKEERFDRVTRIACKLFGVPISAISFLETERQWMKSTQGFDIKEAPRKTSFCGHALLSDEIMIVEDATKDKRFYDNPFVLGEPHFRFYLGCPLKVKGHNVGVICLIDDKPKSKKEVDQNMVYDLAKMVETDLEQFQISLTDELTGLSNRRGFLKLANYLFKKCQREKQIFTLLFFDLDKFKYINDHFGHAEGDKVLKAFANALLHNFRYSDVIARLGGDEFCVFCSGLNQENVANIIERLDNSLKSVETKGYKIEFSVGSIQYNHKEHQTLEDMLALADSKMYCSKKGKQA